ncbi:MAG: TetR/AcrR family transcriptional regulator [Myxococcota bacterium]|jgi:AcrR family transcriptional regulator|nr:TetR/AcrR family transcriptional regulator [Myxococcota bacterium]
MPQATGPAPEAPEERRPGRPRDGRIDEAILEAIGEMILEGGYQSLSFEGVAARSGVTKNTVYRRYKKKADLALAFLDGTHPHLPAPDPGASVDLNVQRMLRRMVQEFDRDPTLIGVISSLAGDEQSDPQLRAAVNRYSTQRLQPLFDALALGIERGELPDSTDIEAGVTLLYGPVLMEYMLHGPVTLEQLDSMVAIVLTGLRTLASDSNEQDR